MERNRKASLPWAIALLIVVFVCVIALVAGRVISVDLRRDVEPLEWWVAQYHPDAVVMAYSLQMLRDDEYEFN